MFCNCDDFEASNFVKYFSDNFENLGLKKLYAMGYSLKWKASYLMEKNSYNWGGVKLRELKTNWDFRSE